MSTDENKLLTTTQKKHLFGGPYFLSFDACIFSQIYQTCLPPLRPRANERTAPELRPFEIELCSSGIRTLHGNPGLLLGITPRTVVDMKKPKSMF